MLKVEDVKLLEYYGEELLVLEKVTYIDEVDKVSRKGVMTYSMIDDSFLIVDTQLDSDFTKLQLTDGITRFVEEVLIRYKELSKEFKLNIIKEEF